MTDILLRVYVTVVSASIIFLLTISYFDPGAGVISNDLKPDRGNLVHSSNNSKVSQVFFCVPTFENLPEVRHFPNFITLGLTIIASKETETFSEEFAYKIGLNVRSLLTFSSGTPLHFVIITDQKSIHQAARILNTLFSQYLSEGVITTEWRRLKGMPRLKVSFVDVNDIIQTDVMFFEAMKNNSLQANIPSASYTESLFYIAPIYHKAFTGLKRIIFLDSKDLEFRSDIGLLEQQFKKMSPTALIGIGPDLTPHYRIVLTDYISQHPNTTLGLPGPFQGYNSGVVLYQLDRMRRSSLYNHYTTVGGVERLMSKFSYKMFLAEQDWLTNLGFTHPNMIYNLPCQFNRQTSIKLLKAPWLETFNDYHGCDKPSSVHIFHRNGCGPTPQTCGNKELPRNMSQFYDINLDIGFLWQIIQNISSISKHSKLKEFSNLLNNLVIMNCIIEAREYCLGVRKLEIPLDG